jgi:hypothetical protein
MRKAEIEDSRRTRDCVARGNVILSSDDGRYLGGSDPCSFLPTQTNSHIDVVTSAFV